MRSSQSRKPIISKVGGLYLKSNIFMQNLSSNTYFLYIFCFLKPVYKLLNSSQFSLYYFCLIHWLPNFVCITWIKFSDLMKMLFKDKWLKWLNLLDIKRNMQKNFIKCRFILFFLCYSSTSGTSDTEIPHLPAEEWSYQYVWSDHEKHWLCSTSYSWNCCTDPWKYYQQTVSLEKL